MAKFAHSHKEEVLTKEKASQVSDISRGVVIKDGNIFMVTQDDAQIPIKEGHGFGLYFNDCRYLKGYELRLCGKTPSLLGGSAYRSFEADHALTNASCVYHGKNIDKEQIGIAWHRVLSDKFGALYDTISFRNYFTRPVEFSIGLEFHCAFEDIFEVRGLISGRFGSRQRPAQKTPDVMRFVYKGIDGLFRSVSIKTSPLPVSMTKSRMNFKMSLKANEQKKISVSMILQETKKQPPKVKESLFWPDLKEICSKTMRTYQQWTSKQTGIPSDNALLNRLVKRSFHDLYLLRSYDGQQHYFAAGVPWFVTLFGRDAIITALQTMAFNPWIARKTLRILAQYQSREVDPLRDAQPGKILHELRRGELANAGRIPHTPYYGSIDATPLFLILMAEYLLWTADLKLLEELRLSVDAALDWIDSYGDTDHDGYTDYDSKVSGRHLVNQGWKDSGNAILRPDGALCAPPIALCEVQGYVYMAKVKMAQIFRFTGETERAVRLEQESRELQNRFNRDFWMKTQKCFALALEKGGRQVAMVSSNAGQTLWTGIAQPQKAADVVKNLMHGSMFTGWGIRTLSALEKVYNPMSYHLGSVWPHDNALISAGFRRYGFDDAAAEIYAGIMEAAALFRHGRLPELFCGHSKREFDEPIRYPVACHPQAWGAGTIPYMIQTMLGLFPDALGRKLRIERPMLPPLTEYMCIKGLNVGPACLDILFQKRKSKIQTQVLQCRGKLEVVIDS